MRNALARNKRWKNHMVPENVTVTSLVVNVPQVPCWTEESIIIELQVGESCWHSKS